MLVLMMRNNGNKIKVAAVIGTVLVGIFIGVSTVLNQQSLAQRSPTVTTIVIPQGLSDPMSGKSFQPQTITVVIGKSNTVRWVNQDSSIHWIEPDIVGNPDFQVTELPENTPIQSLNLPNILSPGGSFEYTFAKPGTFGFHGQPWERGTVIVLTPQQAAAENP